MKIVGICGYIKHGKSTFAELLTAIDPDRSIHHETSHVVVELANVFNAELHKYIHSTQSSSEYIDIVKNPIRAILPEVRRMTGRPLSAHALDIDTADLTRNPEWYDKLFLYIETTRRVPNMPGVTITKENKDDYRSLLQWIGGYVLYKLDDPTLWYKELVNRASYASPDITLAALTAPRQPAEAEFIRQAGGTVVKVINPRIVNDSTDVTERRVAEIIPDTTIVNNGTIGQLESAARLFRKDLFDDSIKTIYTAKP